MNGDPVPAAHVALIHYGAEGGSEAAPQARPGHGPDRVGEGYQVFVGIVDVHELGEGAPVREAGLKLIGAHVLVAGPALSAGAAAAHEGDRHPLSARPLLDPVAHRRDRAHDFVPRHVRGIDHRVVALPPMPVASAHPAGLHRQHDAVGRRGWFGDRPQFEGRVEIVVDESLHDSDGQRYTSRIWGQAQPLRRKSYR